MNHRLFAAIRPPAEVIDALLDLAEKPGSDIAGARWQDESQLHLTLRFFGEISAPQADDIDAALAQVRAAPFALALRGVGHFETGRRPHTLWAGLAPSDPLLALQRQVETAARRAELPPETRKFAPHITLARLNRAGGPVLPFLSAQAALTSEPWPVEAFDLMESTLTAAGAQYETVRRYRMIG
ncbi:MAG: RNA 2',3'-cyclic phosphodiesterase [Qipengyuania sp.]|nr:RNA 2',3'-cyclic phosphodiesterase [Qipengyuania sp.]